MIFDTLVVLIFGWLPPGGIFSSTVHTGAQYFGTGMSVLNLVLPISELHTILLIALGFAIAKQAFRIGVWVVGIIRGSGGMIQPN